MFARRYFIILSLLIMAMSSNGQSLHIVLNACTTEDRATSHLEPFREKFPSNLILPRNDTAGAFFMAISYTFGHPYIYIMVIAKSDGELLYIDKNCDLDLTNDGPPAFFSQTQNKFTFEIPARDDLAQKAKFVLLRNPDRADEPDSIILQRVDKEGNLTPTFTQRVVALLGDPNFTGKRGTFYWDDRVNLRRGTVTINGKPCSIGLLDRTNNGRFDDDTGYVRDCLLVDIHETGKLTTYDEATVFKLTDVFPIAGKIFKVSSIDKFGRWIDLQQTNESRRFSFFHEEDSTVHGAISPNVPIRQVMVDSLWRVSLKTIDGGEISLAQYRGKYILLNFWGEWCKPCLREIPGLVQVVEMQDSSKFKVVSLLKVMDRSIARQTILEKGIKWPQAILTPELEEQCNIHYFPTNILMLPNGKDCIRISTKIDNNFFREYVK